MSLSKRKASAALPGRNMNAKGDAHVESTPITGSGRTIDDLPPEVLTIILEFLTLDASLEAVLGYRLVKPEWKTILNPIIEKRIVSGEFVFQGGMKMMGAGQKRQYDQLHVSTHFQPGENPFQFNSLLLTGDKSVTDFYHNPGRRHIPMLLPIFASTFGGNVTSFALQDQIIPITTLVAMFGSMPRLKLVSFINVKLVNGTLKPDATLPTPPPLTDLVTVEVKASPVPVNCQVWNDKRNVLCMWLLASYADQLVCLKLDTKDPLPPLQRSHQYSHSLPKGKLFWIASTSESAFAKVKELKISRPTMDFLCISELPALQKMSVTGLAARSQNRVDFVSVVTQKYRGSLDTLCLDVPWKDLMDDVGGHILEANQLLPIAGVEFPKMKTLAIRYPSEHFQEALLSEKLLRMLPALETLELLHFRPYVCESAMYDDVGEEEEVVRNDIEPAVDIMAQKLMLTRLNRRFGFNMLRANEAHINWLTVNNRDDVSLEEVDAAYKALEAAIQNLDQVMSTTRNEMGVVFRRLAALGENLETVVVEQLVERRGFWITCPNLKIVMVNSGEKPGGDLCLIRRMDEVA